MLPSSFVTERKTTMLSNEKWVYPPVEVEIPLKSWQKLLLDAADIIEKRGWTQGVFENNLGVCLIGALHLADNGNVKFTFKPRGFNYWWARHKLNHHIRSKLQWNFSFFPGLNCIKWNDNVAKGADDVTRVLRTVGRA